ncbi:MAG: HAD family phosphatase [Planctomycetaceae bacterium]
MIKTCFFDMGNVLMYFCHQTMCRNVAAVCGISVHQATDLLLQRGLQWQLERGEISEEEFHEGFQRETGNTFSIDDLRHAVADIFHLNEPMVPLVDELKSAGIRLVLLSNTCVTHLNYIERNYDLLQRFDALTTSFQAKALKPHAAIYEAALSMADAEPEECFYTDDIEAYVVQARTYGINAEVYTDTGKTRAALRSLGVAVSE